MYQTIQQASYTKISYYSVKFLPPSNPNSPHFHSLSSDASQFPCSVPYLPPNFTGFESQPACYPDPIAVSPCWVAEQAAPLPYSFPFNNEDIASTSYDVPLNKRKKGEKSVSNLHKRKLKRPKANLKNRSANQNTQSKLCKIESSDVQLYEKFSSRKKHGKCRHKISAQSATSSVVQASLSNNNGSNPDEKGIPNGPPAIPSTPDNLVTKKRNLLESGTAVESLRVCTICNVACNGEIAFADHLAGKKHAAQEHVLCSEVDPNLISPSCAGWWCEVCQISCSSTDTLAIHRQGKKHRKNLNKLQKQTTDTSVPH